MLNGLKLIGPFEHGIVAKERSSIIRATLGVNLDVHSSLVGFFDDLRDKFGIIPGHHHVHHLVVLSDLFTVLSVQLDQKE